MPVTSTMRSLATTTNKPAVKDQVLMLSTRYSTNVPMVIGLDGDVDDHLDFEYGAHTEVYGSCGASLEGEMFVLGGTNKKRQLSKVRDCQLTRVGDLPFDFYGGGCNTFDFGILMCFSSQTDQECHSFNGISFKTEPSSKFSHTDVYALGSYRNSPFVTGSYWSPNTLKTEILDYKAKRWTEVKDYPFSSTSISHYATTHTADSVYIIGGYSWGGGSTSRIAEYKNDIWRIAGKHFLKQARSGHGAITVNGLIMIIGGYQRRDSTLDTELWDFESTKTEIINPTLPSDYDGHGLYAYGLGLFTVEAGFCNQSKTTTTNVYTTTNGFTGNVYTYCIILFSLMPNTGFL